MEEGFGNLGKMLRGRCSTVIYTSEHLPVIG
jgi:hypothetical protein